MLSDFLYAFNALMPILLIIFLGFYLRKIDFLSLDFLEKGNKLMFKIALPSMLFVNVYKGVESIADINWSAVIFSIIMILALFVCGLVVSLVFIKDKKQKGVVLQCTFRSNFAIIGLVLAESLGGPEATAVVGIFSAFAIVIFNVLAVISLTVFSDAGKFNPWKILTGIIKNPLILGIFAGVVALLLKNVFPVHLKLKFAYSAAENLGKLASPLALLVLGGRFSFKQGGGMLKEIIIGTAMRVVFAPVVSLSAAVILTFAGVVSFGASEFPAFIAMFATPVAVSSAVMAAEMKSDTALADQLVVWTSVVSVVTIFVFVVVLRNLGFL